MEIHRFQESFAFQFRVDCESIWRRFGINLGSIWGLGRVLGGFGASLGAQDRISIDLKSILGPLVGPSRPQLGGLEAFWGALGRLVAVFGSVVSPFISDLISDSFSDFILHRFRTPKRRQNQ